MVCFHSSQLKFALLSVVSAAGFAALAGNSSSPNPSGTPSPTPVKQTPITSPSPSATPAPTPKPTPVPPKEIEVDQALYLYVPDGDVLVAKLHIQTGTRLFVPVNYSLSNMNFKRQNGKISRSSTGFIYPVTVNSKSSAHGDEDLEFYAPASIIGALQGVEGVFSPVATATPTNDYLIHHRESGEPRFSFVSRLEKRFGERLNKGTPRESLSAKNRKKWRRIFAEIIRVADRTKETPRSLLIMERSAARHWSESFEKTGAIAQAGTWSIAIQTAERHGFGNTPCAEFMSEILRQAYERAGYDVRADFNEKKKNVLSWRTSASVFRLARALDRAGFIPWNAEKYRPPIGAIMMAGAAETPGHTFVAAGDDGRLIVDNGSPQGRDLRAASEETLVKMYNSGVFFLPPGENPQLWVSANGKAQGK